MELLSSLLAKRSVMFRLWQLVIFTIRAVTPLSLLWLMRVAQGEVCGTLLGVPSDYLYNTATAWAIIEVLFFIYYVRVR